jgi:hypothetical protein
MLLGVGEAFSVRIGMYVCVCVCMRMLYESSSFGRGTQKFSVSIVVCVCTMYVCIGIYVYLFYVREDIESYMYKCMEARSHVRACMHTCIYSMYR